MDKAKEIILKNFEGLFVVLILATIGSVHYLVDLKLAFLNFYFLPIMLAGYFLGKRLAMLGALLAALGVGILVVLNHENYSHAMSTGDQIFAVSAWGGFLILAAWLVGRLAEDWKMELGKSTELQGALVRERDLLDESNKKLQQYSTQLESKVKARTQELERSHTTIEALKGKAEEALFSVMDSTVARLMIEGKLRNEKRRISVLFSDLKDFTSYSDRHPPEQVVDELNLYLNEMENCITRFHGHIDKYMGDGIMVEFGAPIHYKMHSLMALLAGLNMQERMLETHPKWKMRVGVATGPTVIGLFGTQRKSYSCIGDTANLASRLEHLCEPGGVFIDEETLHDVQPYVETAPVRAFYGQRENDRLQENEIQVLEKALLEDPDNPQTLYGLGQALMKNREASAAMECFQRILEKDPQHNDAKLGYAEASMKRNEYEKIAIKGKADRLSVYRVIGLRDPLMDRNKIPQGFYDRYADVVSKIKVPEEVILPIECLDGTLRHGRTVAVLSYAMAEQMKQSNDFKEDILIGAFLHDLGHVIIPHALLDASRTLTETEREIIYQHPGESVQKLKLMGYQMENMLEMVQSHHEYYNGTGYPCGLKGDEIPLGGRIIAVADAYDAMTSIRLHKETWACKSALREIEKDANAGKYDMQCVDVLKELLDS